MTTDFAQTNGFAGQRTAFCSGNSNNTTDTESCQADYGAALGSAPRVITLDASAADLNCLWMEIINAQEDGYNGAAGNWTIRVNVSVGNHQVTLDEIWICHVDSGYSVKNTLGSLTGIGESWSGSGIKTHTVNQASGVTMAAGDMIMVIFACDNAQAMGQDFNFTPDQNITGPGDIVVEAARRIFITHV